MTQGIAAYRLNHVAAGEGLTAVNPALNEKFIVIIDDEIWLVRADGQRELTGHVTDGPRMVAGTRLDSLSNLPEPVRAVVAARCEALDAQV